MRISQIATVLGVGRASVRRAIQRSADADTDSQDPQDDKPKIKGPRPRDCWIWTGAISDDGYGRFWVSRDGRQRALRPQRFAYEDLTGETLHPDIALMHVCDVPLCVHASSGGDSHLLPGTQELNMLDRSQKGRHANAPSFRWRGVGRHQFRAQSVALRAALLEHGWNEPIIRPLLTGTDPEPPTLF